MKQHRQESPFKALPRFGVTQGRDFPKLLVMSARAVANILDGSFVGLAFVLADLDVRVLMETRTALVAVSIDFERHVMQR